jgi:pimeloyl-ACP methyl ester carboxylesterase
VIPKLVKGGHRVLALDLKGFGWTDRPPGDYSPEAQAQLVLALMDARAIDKATVVGHSWGASVALAMAIAAPARVEKLALYDAWAYDEQLPTFFLWARVNGLGESLFWLWYDERSDERIALAFFDKRFVTERLVEMVGEALDRPGTKAAALAAVRGQHYERMEKHYAKIAQPTLLLWGREDVVTPPTYGERLARTLPNARLVVYPRCGHFPMLEAASASTADLIEFLGPLPVAAPEPAL